MQQLKKFTTKILAVILVVMILTSMAMPVYAEVAEQPVNNETFENVEPTQTPEPSIVPSAEPSIVPSAEPSIVPSAEPSIAPSAVPTEEPQQGFVTLQVESFNQIAEILEDGTAKFSVKLNREDVAVTYQWQINKPVVQEEKELLFDYSSYSDTSYFFPFDGITEEELLAINPYATWPGIEMYLEAVENANKTRSAVVKIENGTPNTYLNEFENGTIIDAQVPVWKNIEGANTNEYTFTPNEENTGATYRCVITITDEEYIKTAQQNATDVYGI